MSIPSIWYSNPNQFICYKQKGKSHVKLKKRRSNESVTSLFPFLHWLSLFKIRIFKWDLAEIRSWWEAVHMGNPTPLTVPDWAPALGGTGAHLGSATLASSIPGLPDLSATDCDTDCVTVPHCEQATVKHFWDIKAEEIFLSTNLGAEGKYY